MDPVWLHRRRNDPKVKLVEIAGMGQEQMQAYRAGHLPGAVCWTWQDMLWDSHRREFPSPEEFARRCARAGIANDTTVVFYGEPLQFGVYAWWVFRYCGHARATVLDGAIEAKDGNAPRLFPGRISSDRMSDVYGGIGNRALPRGVHAGS